ncbi:hypothetical protein [Actinokineospora enzanensis]|uniref:hypothetical protein n=1 Tax=Actinokineospora enzanensis TaxID=155975 RepID=UPI00036D50F6|nr:hypothetical protein [Actinokineospora enzanensis]
MNPPGTKPEDYYQLNPEAMREGIRLYLTPVIDQLGGIAAQVKSAHGDIAAAHIGSAPGWSGGPGHGDLKAASSSFFNEAEYQLRQLSADQDELAASLAEYRAALEAHIDWAVRTDEANAEQFRRIDRERGR